MSRPEDLERKGLSNENQKREEEKAEKARKLREAVKDPEQFLQLVRQMMDENKTMIEMMVILDVEEQEIIEAQDKISREEQIKQLEAYRKMRSEQQKSEAASQ